MKQTAVNLLIEKLLPFIDRRQVSDTTLHNIVEEHLAMEKEQIIEASAIAYEDMFGSDGTKYGQEYYNKTFKSE